MSQTTLSDHYAVAVIGAGPGGLAAASACARAGLETVVFDEQPSPGGQIYRAITDTPLKREALLGKDYWCGAHLADAFKASGARYLSGATVWSLTPEREIGVSIAGHSSMTHASRVIVASGALERPFPVPGWTLPGVMTAGGAQILLKTSGLVPKGRTVLAGCGPLLWLLAAQYLNAGVKIDAMLDTTPAGNLAQARPHLLRFLFSPYFRKGIALVRAVKRSVTVVSRVTRLRAVGEGRVTHVAYSVQDGTERQMPVDTLLLHQGVVPNVNLAMAAGVEHYWDDEQLCWVPRVDEYGASSIDGVAIVGDGAGIGGARAAEYRGMLAAVATIRALSPGSPLPDEKSVRRALSAELRARRFVDLFYRPAPAFRQPVDDTIVCRCEEVTARQIEDAVALGCPGPNQMKAFLRCGMGPCQGRLCGLTLTELIAKRRALTPQAAGYYHVRTPVKPITVAEFAALPKTPAAIKAAER